MFLEGLVRSWGFPFVHDESDVCSHVSKLCWYLFFFSLGWVLCGVILIETKARWKIDR